MVVKHGAACNYKSASPILLSASTPGRERDRNHPVPAFISSGTPKISMTELQAARAHARALPRRRPGRRPSPRQRVDHHPGQKRGAASGGEAERDHGGVVPPARVQAGLANGHGRAVPTNVTAGAAGVLLS